MATYPVAALRRAALWAPLVLASLSAGCVTLPVELGGPAPHEPVCQAVAMWQNSVVQAADPTRGGAPNNGLAGKVYLFGQDAVHTLVGDGKLIVDMFDETAGPADVPVERWDFHANDFARLGKKDMMGWGYNVFLPSSRLNPGMVKIKLRLCYQPKKGNPVFTENAVTLDSGNGIISHGGPSLTARQATTRR